MGEIKVGDLVEFRYDYFDQQLVGVVTYSYKYNGHMWHKVLWAGGRQQDIAEVELRKIKTDNANCPHRKTDSGQVVCVVVRRPKNI